MGSSPCQVNPKTKHAALRRKSKDWLARNQNNVSESAPDLPIGSTDWNLWPQYLRGLRPRCIICLSLLSDFHTYVVIAYYILSKQPFSNLPYTVALHFRILQNFKHSPSPSLLFKLIKHTSIFLQSWRWGIGRGLASGITYGLYLNLALVRVERHVYPRTVSVG